MVTNMRRITYAVLLVIVSATAFAAKINDVANTKHNLSASGPGPVKATTESQICVFCHTPHKANAAAKAPLWNRKLSGQTDINNASYTAPTYTLYTSDSIQASLGQPDGSSKLCLSCHDGTMALGSVGVLNGQVNVSITGVGATTMPAGSGTTTGYTRNLGGATGIDLSNDHPISFDYTTTLTGNDGELMSPGAAPGNTYIKNRTPGAMRPDVPLENGKVQCVACHDPHIRDNTAGANAKFLRLNRFQENAAVSGVGSFDKAKDQVCLGCHSKAGWSGSAHANQAVATQTYLDPGAAQREFPVGLPVWQAGCLNCHDTHTVQGARRLLREGTDSAASPKAGGNPAQEETCYQCHNGGSSVITPNTTVPNIRTDFVTAGNKRMPITTADQPAGSEVHSITDKDFTETTTLLGTTASNRHVECTDCHNPHRVIKNRLFNANPATADAAGTHTHALAGGQPHSNLASGVLAGTTGVEPVYGADNYTTWATDQPGSFDVKKGYGGVGASPAVASTWVTREYQVCLKCHSNNAWTTAPALGSFTGGTPAGTNGVNSYTNQATEFRAPANHQGTAVPTPTGWLVNNHRSWHPVMAPTGRSATIRFNNANPAQNGFLAPWNGVGAADADTYIGSQTMYCTDCHGSDTGVGTVDPNGGENGNPWGPHGSSRNFILKGTWDNETGNGGALGAADTTGICFKCHDWNQYANPLNLAPKLSGFRAAAVSAACNMASETINLHTGHAARLNNNVGMNMECTWCHTAVPHGWKNKALLINVFVDAPECNTGALQFNGCNSTTSGPYIREGYLGAGQFVGGTAMTWATSGNWAATNCGGRNWMNGMLSATNNCQAPL